MSLEDKTTVVKSEDNLKELNVEEPKEKKGYEELENGNILVHTKDGDFELEDIPHKETERLIRILTADGAKQLNTRKLTMMLIAKSIKNRNITDEEMDNFKTSTMMKLQKVSEKLYDIQGFL